MKLAGHVARMGKKSNACRLLVRNQEGKRPLGRPRRRWVDNIRMDLGEVGWGNVDWIGLAQDRNRWRALVNSVLNLRVPWNAGKLSSGLTSSRISSSAQLHKSWLVNLSLVKTCLVNKTGGEWWRFCLALRMSCAPLDPVWGNMLFVKVKSVDIWGFNDSKYEYYCHVWCDIMSYGEKLTIFRVQKSTILYWRWMK
jgi:hypothetical protein